MRRSLAERLTALVLGLVFLGSAGGDAFGYHTCPHHDGIGGAHASAQASVDHSDHAATPAGADKEVAAESHDSTEPCSCLGHCTAPDAAANPAASPATSAVPALWHESHEPSGVAAPRARITAYVLPPATAPPSSC
ncbi:MAG: hypothetical protein ACREMQ_16825 [Longimicrobiales bacterium]